MDVGIDRQRGANEVEEEDAGGGLRSNSRHLVSHLRASASSGPQLLGGARIARLRGSRSLSVGDGPA